MSKQITSTDQKQNIHRRAQWITKYIEKQKKQMTLKKNKIPICEFYAEICLTN